MAAMTEREQSGENSCESGGHGDGYLHGGDIYHNDVELDFSVNVNPLGMPERVRRALFEAVEECGHYPDPDAGELKAAVSGAQGVEGRYILCGNGASELLTAAVRAIGPERIVIPVPSFYGYEHAARACGGKIFFYPLLKSRQYQYDEGLLEALTGKSRLVFLANPNNPVGNLADRDFLDKLLRHCRQRGIYVLVDECFLELCRGEKENSMLNRLEEFPNLMVLRAFTKTYAIPGVRLGYLCCADGKLLGKIRAQLPEWNLSVFAQRAGVAALSERDYLRRSVDYVERERRFLAERARRCGLSVWEGAANFLMMESSLPLYQELLARRILIRDCGNFRGLSRGYYRIAVGRREDNEKLIAALEEICHHENGDGDRDEEG